MKLRASSLLPALFSFGSLVACATVAVVGAPHAGGAPRETNAVWVASWGASVHPGDPPLAVDGQTLRQIVHLSVGGARARVRLSNAEGATALRVGAAHVALSTGGSAIAPGSDRALTFGGVVGVVIPAGAIAVSDPVTLAVPAGSDLAVSLFVPEASAATTEHSLGHTTYVSARGDFTGADAFANPAGAVTRKGWYWLTGVDVESATGASAVVALGDSLTDGYKSTPDANHRWTDFLARRLNASHGGPALAVVNAGIIGNGVTRDILGNNGLARLERDVLAQPGVKYVILLEGDNDLAATATPPETVATAGQVIAAYRQIVARAHARGVKVLGGTLPPFEEMHFEGFAGTTVSERAREEVNAWIRTSGAYDGVIDFDQALRDPARPSRLLARFDSGDHGHPNDAGYEAMAEAIDLSLFDGDADAGRGVTGAQDVAAPVPDADRVAGARQVVKLAAGGPAEGTDAGSERSEGGDVRVALTHVLLFDGTLAPPRAEQTIVIERGRIATVGPSSAVAIEPGTTVLDLTGRAVFPGIVGMHDHLYYIAVAGRSQDGHRIPFLPELAYTAPRLYLAGGVTTLRTTGSVEPYADLDVRRRIEAGAMPGPDIDVTAPYLEGPGGAFPQMPAIKTAEQARRFVAYWAEQGATSIKAYTHVSREVLRAAIEEAHRRRMKVTGHLCSVTYAEAAAMGIDDLEHGFFVANDLLPGKKLDDCADDDAAPVLARDPASPEVQALLKMLVSRHVAVTSTLPVFEDSLPGRAPSPRAIELLEPLLQARYRAERKSTDARPNDAAVSAFRNELTLERAFVAQGGLLLAGPDPTGMGGVLPGFGDQREIELLVEAGFSGVEAIHIATFNGAAYLGRLDRIGTVAPGKQADLVVVRGDPSARIADVENVEWVFKRGVGYDPEALLASVKGTVGVY